MSSQASNNKISIKVVIADRPYPLKVSSAKEEEVIRKAAKNINDKISEFKETYAGDKQDYLAMSALIYGIEALKNQNDLVDDDQACLKQLDTMNQRIDEALAST